MLQRFVPGTDQRTSEPCSPSIFAVGALALGGRGTDRGHGQRSERQGQGRSLEVDHGHPPPVIREDPHSWVCRAQAACQGSVRHVRNILIGADVPDDAFTLTQLARGRIADRGLPRVAARRAPVGRAFEVREAEQPAADQQSAAGLRHGG